MNVMNRLLFEVFELKNSSRGLNASNVINRNRVTLGNLIDSALKSETPLMISVQDHEAFSLQQLSNYVNMQNNLDVTKPLEDDFLKMRDIIEGMIEKSAMTSDEKLVAQNNLLDKSMLGKLFPVDTSSTSNIETKSLRSIPKLDNLEEVQEVLRNLSGSPDIDDDAIQFLEDFLAMNENPEAAEEVIQTRLKNANALLDKPLEDKDITANIQNRKNRIFSIKRRFDALKEAESEVYLKLKNLFTPGRELAPGVFLPDLNPVAIDGPVSGIDDSVHSVLEAMARSLGLNENETAESIINSANQSLSGPGNVNSAKYTRIQDYLKSAKMKEVYEGLLKNKTKIAGVAAIGTGLAIFGSIRNKERTQESLSGPPLLPGGNPYERIPNTPMNLSEAPTAQSNQGMSYNVSVNGDQDKIQEFMTRARTGNKRSNARYYA